jgi:KUP system potassium uptake protein
MTSQAEGVPHALLHNLKHNKVLHERSIFLKVAIEDVPSIEEDKQVEIEDLGQGFFRIVLHFGFMQDMNVPETLAKIDRCGLPFRMMDTSFFLSRQTPLASNMRGMALWRERLFAWMMRNAESPMEFFALPANRVVEMGSQIKI